MAGQYAFDYKRYNAGQALDDINPAPYVRETALPKIKRATKQKTNINNVLIMVLIAVVFVVVFRYTLINEINSNNTKLEKQLNTVTTECDMARISLDRTTDLNYVEAVAREKLNMDFPQSHQIINVTLENADKVVKTEPAKSGALTALGNFFGGMLEYLY